MNIRCPDSHRFLCSVNSEDFFAKMSMCGVSVSVPIRVTIPCHNCHAQETYNVYADRAELVNKAHIDKK